ncbi:MAG: hypothetical protein M1549_02130, partial [Candidatus Dependentiae bacterium]|nr:hypothetical protein [Candidatus Dependentiae bacterium]
RYVFLTTDENGNLFVLVNKQRSPFLPEDAVKANEGTIEYTELGSKVLLRLGSGALSVLTNYGRENGGELLSLIKDGNKQLDDTNADILIALTRAGISLETLRQASEIKKLCDIKKILALKKQQSQIELKIQEKKPDEAKLKEAVEIKKRENEEKKKKLEELKKLTCTPVFYADEQNKLFVLVDQNKNPYFLKKATKKPSEISDLLKTLKYSWLLRADAKGNALPDNANKTANCRALIATQQLTPQNYQWISADGLKEVLTTVDLDEMAKKAFERRQNARNRLESENLKRESENLKRENEKIKIEKENENLENKKEIEKLDIENLKLENKKIEENFEKIEIEQLENKKEHLENKKELEKIKIENKKENEKLDIENEKNEHLEKSLLWWHPVQDLLFNSVIGFVVAAAKDYVKPTGLKNHMALLIPTSFAIRRAPNLKQRTMHTLACLGSYLGGNYLYKGLNWAGKQLYNTLT